MRNIVALLILVVLLFGSFFRNEIWQNDATLWLNVAMHSPDKPRGYNEIGLYYIDRQEYQKSFEVLQRSLQLNPYQPTIYVNLGLAYEGVGLQEKAMEIYQRAITLSPDDPTAYYNLGILYYDLKKDRVRALELLSRARDLNPFEPDVHSRLAMIYRDLGREDLAQEEYRKYKMLK